MRPDQAKILLLAFACLIIGVTANAQKRNNIWLFGIKSGLNFNTNPATPISTNPLAIRFPNSLSSISDTSGNLIFYTDGLEIWNQYKNKLPKKINNWPWGGYTAPLLIPYIGNDSLYYLFGVSNRGVWPNTLSYVTLNSNADGGRGGVVYPEPSTPVNYFTRLVSGAKPLLAATSHCNQKDLWVVTYKQNAFYSYQVTASGVSSTPVVSTLPAGMALPDTVVKYNIKFSANSEKLVFPVISKNKTMVLDFNNLTGVFSNPVQLSIGEGETLEDVELSPDGSLLYYGSFVTDPDGEIELHDVFQADLRAGSADQIKQSVIRITPFPDRAGCTPHGCYFVFRTLNIGPDGKIYVSMRDNFPFASVIEEPTERGTQARYIFVALGMKTEYTHMSYNYVRSFSYSAKQNGIQMKKANCADLPVDFTLLFARADSVKWDFGDPATGSNNHSASLTPQHTFTSPGDYTVKAVIYHRCFVDTAESTVHIRADKAVKLPESIRDTTVCLGNVFTLDATDRFSTNYTWNVENYLTYEPRIQVRNEGVYDITIRNLCSIDRKVFTVKYTKCDCHIFVPTAFTPNRDGLNDIFKPETKCYVQQYRFIVINRFGQVVFSSTDPQKGWDGYLGPYMQSSGTYIWQVQYKDPNSAKMLSEKGTVLLIR